MTSLPLHRGPDRLRALRRARGDRTHAFARAWLAGVLPVMVLALVVIGCDAGAAPGSVAGTQDVEATVDARVAEVMPGDVDGDGTADEAIPFETNELLLRLTGAVPDVQFDVGLSFETNADAATTTPIAAGGVLGAAAQAVPATVTPVAVPGVANALQVEFALDALIAETGGRLIVSVHDRATQELVYTLRLPVLPPVSSDRAPPRVTDIRSAAPSAIYDQVRLPGRAIGVDPAAPLTVQFDEPVDPVTLADAISLVRAGSRELEGGEVGVRPVALAIDTRNNPTIILTPATALEPGALYRLRIRGGVADVHGNRQSQSAELAELLFQTAGADRLVAATADIDGDAIPDLLVGGPRHDLELRFSFAGVDGAGLAAPDLDADLPAALETVTLGGSATAVGIGDVAGDARPDLLALTSPDVAANPLGLVAWRTVLRRETGAVDFLPVRVVVPRERLNPQPAAPIGLLVAELTGDVFADVIVIDAFGQHALLVSRGDHLEYAGAVIAPGTLPFPARGLTLDILALKVDADDRTDLVPLSAFGPLVWLRNASEAGMTANALDDRARFTVGGLIDPDLGAVRAGAVGDLDRDGFADIALARQGSTPLLLMRRGLTPTAPFMPASARVLDVAYDATALAFGDINADDYPDLMAGPDVGGGLLLFLNDREGGLCHPAALPLAMELFGPWGPALEPEVWSMLLVDVDGDGQRDVFVVGEPTVLLSTAGGLWRAPLSFTETPGVGFARPDANAPTAARSPHGAVIGDVDGDGHAAIVLATEGGAEIWTARRNGSYLRGDILPTAADAWLQLVDIDGDGDLDVIDVPIGARDAAATSVLAYLHVNLGGSQHGTLGVFGAPSPLIELPAGAAMESVTDAAFVDLDGDGRLDAVFAGAQRVRTFRQLDPLNGGRDDDRFAIRFTGTFAEVPTPLANPLDPVAATSVRVADIDNDGLLDIVVFADGTVSGDDDVDERAPSLLLRNRGHWQPGDAAADATDLIGYPAGWSAMTALLWFDAETLGVFEGVHDPVFADLDRDGRVDLVWLDRAGSRLVQLRNNGPEQTRGRGDDGPVVWSVMSVDLERFFAQVDGLALLDPDRDGDLDPIVTGRRGDGTVVDAAAMAWQQVWINNAGGEFAIAPEASQALREACDGLALRPMAVGDLTGDGWPDVVAVDDQGRVHLLLTQAHPRATRR